MAWRIRILKLLPNFEADTGLPDIENVSLIFSQSLTFWGSHSKTIYENWHNNTKDITFSPHKLYILLSQEIIIIKTHWKIQWLKDAVLRHTEVISWNKILERLTVHQQIKKFRSYLNVWIRIVFTRDGLSTLSQASWIQSIYSLHI